jgi:L-alanine-DL-glutamate epimerase-like enolase superfamily enzyme
MKLTGLTIRQLAIDAAPRYGPEGIPPGRPATWHYPLITLHTDEGIDGHTMGYGNQGDGRAISCLMRDVFWPKIRGENPLEIERLWLRLRRANRDLYALSDAMSGMIDVALWDILGKVRNAPICDLLGRVRDRVPGYCTGWSFHPTPERAFDEAREMKARGFQGFKCHFWNDPARDIPCIRATREAVGPDYALMQDLNALYDYHDALKVGRVLDELNFTWFEEPIPDRQTGLLRRLADELKTPILGGETVTLDELAEQVRVQAYDIARGDVYMKAGITGLMKAFRLSELQGMRLEIHTMATPLLDLANLHCNLAAKNGGYAEVIHPVYRFGLKDRPLDIDAGGWLHAPTVPGLGAELDWDWLDNHTVDKFEIA